MKRRLIALLLCIAMVGSVTVYAVGDEITATEANTIETVVSVPTVCQSLLACQTSEELYAMVLDIMGNDPDALLALTAEETESLRARINELDPEGDDADTADLLDTLDYIDAQREEVQEGEEIDALADEAVNAGYYSIYQNGKYVSQKMEDVLKNNQKYSVVNNFTIDLFNYDPVQINAALNALTSDGNGFHFTGYSVDGCGSNSGINNSEADFAKQGILSDTLVNGYPVVNYLKGTNAGVDTGRLLFDTTYTPHSGRVDYDDVVFQMIYNEDTRYYEYKSSANHAQLSNDGKKIELYADTLSTQAGTTNKVDLTTAYGMADITDYNVGSVFTGSAKETNSNDRLDPYVLFKLGENGYAAAGIDQIYVKAKVPAAVGTNKFQVFFKTEEVNSWTEDKSFLGSTYTANGDWIEFVIDTSKNSKWTGNVTDIRIDPFDSNKGSVAIDGTYAFEISEIRLTKEGGNYVTYGGFYPFSKIQDSHPGNGEQFSISSWESAFNADNQPFITASRSIGDPALTAATLNSNHLAFGSVIEFDFYIPVDGKVNGKDLTYYFNGDDDLWVYVDDQLVLDIGGGHGAIQGTVNFTTGAWSVNNAVTVTGYNSGAVAENAKSVGGTIDAELYSAGRHTMKVFYLERGGSVSNCFMKFNLPQTPTGSVNVTKEVAENTGASLDVLNKESFEFTIEMQNKGAGDDYKVKAPLANRAFYIVNEDDTTETAATDANGKFYLKDGQKAVFEIAENYNVTVTETAKDIPGYEKVSTTCNGNEATNGTLLTVKDQEKTFAFVNTYDEIEVTISYIPVNPDGFSANKLGAVEFTGNPDSKTSDKNGITETIGASVGVPQGATATDSKIIAFAGWYADPECTKLISTDKVFMPTKADNSNLWESAIYYAKFECLFADLTITKSGIQSVDHGAEEKQSSLFRITGTAYSGKTIDMTVAITGNDDVTIRTLPVGEYTITEISDWSWRYEPSEATKSVTMTVDGANVKFTNTRKIDKWLSGDNWLQNLLSMNPAEDH